MITKRKSKGFFIVEILIVLVIIGILVIALLPNFNLYTSRAKFQDVVLAANALRGAVDGCITQLGTYAGCVNGSYGIPAAIATTIGNMASLTIATNGVIVGVGTPAALGTYTLTPATPTSSGTTWAATCSVAGMC